MPSIICAIESERDGGRKKGSGHPRPTTYDNNNNVDHGDSSCVLIDDIEMMVMVTTIMQMQGCINHAASL